MSKWRSPGRYILPFKGRYRGVGALASALKCFSILSISSQKLNVGQVIRANHLTQGSGSNILYVILFWARQVQASRRRQEILICKLLPFRLVKPGQV